MNTLTIDEAAKLVPAIEAKEPNQRVSSRYQFVSTKEILEQVQEKGWLITNATSQGRSLYAQHRVTLVHQNDLEQLNQTKDDGIMRIELFNSHDRTKRLTFAIGYFRFVCSNGLIVASGPAETIKAKHSLVSNSFANLKEGLHERIGQLTDKFPNIHQKICDLKTRDLTEEEQVSFASFAIKGRYSYRPQLPKKFSDVETAALKVLNVRRDSDAGNSTWAVFNRVQENIINGIPGFSSPLRSYSDNIRVNCLLWKGAEASLEFANKELKTTLQNILPKKK
jgi:hypothetical protein